MFFQFQGNFYNIQCLWLHKTALLVSNSWFQFFICHYSVERKISWSIGKVSQGHPRRPSVDICMLLPADLPENIANPNSKKIQIPKKSFKSVPWSPVTTQCWHMYMCMLTRPCGPSQNIANPDDLFMLSHLPQKQELYMVSQIVACTDIFRFTLAWSHKKRFQDCWEVWAAVVENFWEIKPIYFSPMKIVKNRRRKRTIKVELVLLSRRNIHCCMCCSFELRNCIYLVV